MNEENLVLVFWRDITTHSSWWEEGDECLGCINLVTPGWIIKETDGEMMIGISQKEFDFPRYREHIVIPKGCIIKVIKLKICE